MAFFTQDQLEAIAGALGDTDAGLTGTEIQYLLASSKMTDPGPITKRVRIYNAFVESQNTKKNRTNIVSVSDGAIELSRTRTDRPWRSRLASTRPIRPKASCRDPARPDLGDEPRHPGSALRSNPQASLPRQSPRRGSLP